MDVTIVQSTQMDLLEVALERLAELKNNHHAEHTEKTEVLEY